MKIMRRRILFTVLLLTVIFGAYLIWSGFLSKPQQAIPEIRLGNGIDGPKGMAWIPGGDF